ncbi:MAG: tRNA (adenosine(37)-N6)-threonylcarbamoyltransferase complex dimerization subunit type 1 TsaB [Caulobacteraceae bacterium]|nr:tRNA (adenosine(37)-N6)-threonylcarbamoyltransferase complex dimerization subunit type 1 TsaB [Caulobacteraceae bacterium]
MTLAVDTCLGACTAALMRDGTLVATQSEAMTRGHQERLAPMVQETMAGAGLGFDAIDRFAATVGPGSFTGLRIGLAFAKGLALAMERPCVGVGALEALAASVEDGGLAAALIDAGRGRVFLQAFAGGRALMAPDNLEVGNAAARLAELSIGEDIRLVGPGAALLADSFPTARPILLAAPTALAIVRLAERADAVPPRPLYLRAPDARPKSASR